MVVVAALWLVGVAVATPAVVWWARDVRRIPGRVWYWSGYDRSSWQWAVVLGYLGGGVVAIATVFRWRRSAARAELIDDLHERVAAHDARVADEARLAEEERAAREARILGEATATGEPKDDRPAGRTESNVVRTDARPTRIVASTDRVRPTHAAILGDGFARRSGR